MAQQFIGSDGTYIDPQVLAAARLASNNAQRYRQDSRGLGGLLGSLAAKVGDVGKAVYGTIGGGVASFKDLLESGGANQNNLRAFTNSVYGTNDYKDAVAKQLGTSINAADTLTDFVPGAAALKATPVGGAVVGGISGLGNTLKYEGADFDWNDAGNSIASGAITGAATAGFNQKLNGATKGIGKKLASNAIARGATSGAIGGAIGSGVSGALNGQDLGSILGNMASSATQGAVTGAAMAGVSQLGTKAKNAALGKFWGQTPTQVAGTLAKVEQLRQADRADDGRINNSIPELQAKTETAEETPTGPSKTKYAAEGAVKRPVVEPEKYYKNIPLTKNEGADTWSDAQGNEYYEQTFFDRRGFPYKEMRPVESGQTTAQSLMDEMVNTDDDDRAIEIARQLGVPTGARKATTRELYDTAINSEDPDQAISAARKLGVEPDNSYFENLEAEEHAAMNPQYADEEDEWNSTNFLHDDEGRPIGQTRYIDETSSKQAKAYDNEIKQLAEDYKANKLTDGDVQDVLELFERTSDRDYEDMIYEFNKLTGKPNPGDLMDRQDEIVARLQKALNSGKQAKSESLEQTLGNQTKNMTKSQIIEDLIDTGGAAGYSQSQLKRMTKSQLLELADIQSSETVPTAKPGKTKYMNESVGKQPSIEGDVSREPGGMTSERMMEILAGAHEALGEHPSREALHEYNELARRLQSELEWDLASNPVVGNNDDLKPVQAKTLEADKLNQLRENYEAARKNAQRRTTWGTTDEDFNKANDQYRKQLVKMVKASDKYDAATKKEIIADIKDGIGGYSDAALKRLGDTLLSETATEPSAAPEAITSPALATAKTRAEKAEWIHDKIVDLYEPYGNRRLTDSERKALLQQVDAINAEADAKFDTPSAPTTGTPQAIATANGLKKLNDTQLADTFATIENADEITSDDYVLMNQIADEAERRGDKVLAKSMRSRADYVINRTAPSAPATDTGVAKPWETNPRLLKDLNKLADQYYLLTDKGYHNAVTYLTNKYAGVTRDDISQYVGNVVENSQYRMPQDKLPTNADGWEHMLTNGLTNGRTLANKIAGFSNDDLKNIAEVYQRNGNARKTIDDMLTEANFLADKDIMQKRAALADAERTYRERAHSEPNGGYKEMLEPARKRKVVEGPAYPDDIMNMKINRGEWGEPTGNEDYTEPTNERYSLNTDDDQGVKPRPDLRNEDIEVPDYTKPVDREGNPIKIEKRNWIQGAGERFSRAGDRIENQDIYNSLYSKTADRAIREGTIDTLKKLGYKPQDYGEAAKVSTGVNQMVDSMVENSRATLNDPDLIDNLRNIADSDSVVLTDAQRKKLDKQIRTIVENVGQGDKPFTYDAAKLLKESRRLVSAGGKAITQANYVNGQPQNTEGATYGNQMIEMGRYLRQRVEEATDGLFDNKYTKDQVATMLRNAGANDATIDYVTDTNSLSDLIKKTSVFEQARQMDREMKNTPYRRNGVAGTGGKDIVNRFFNRSGLGEVVDLALTPVGKVTGAGTKALGNLMTKAGNAYAAVDQYPGLTDQGAITVANAAARNASNLASQQSNDQYYFDQNPETAQAAAAQFEAQNGLGGINTQLGTQNGLTSGMMASQAQPYQDPAQQQAVSTLNRLAAGMQNALNAGDIKAYETIADIYSQYAKIYSAQAEINGWNATAEAEDEKLTANQQKALAAMQQLNQLASMQPDFGTAVSNVPILGNIVGMTGGNQYATQASALETTLVNLLSGTSATEAEREQIRRAYIPQFTDSDAVKQQKLQSAYQLIQNLYNSRNNWANQVDDYASGFFG